MIHDLGWMALGIWTDDGECGGAAICVCGGFDGSRSAVNCSIRSSAVESYRVETGDLC